MNEARVILIAPSTYGSLDPAPLARIEKAGFRLRRNPFGRKLSRDELVEALAGVVGIVAGLEPLSRDVLEHSQLKVVSRCGVGLDNVDLDAARELGIRVFSTPNAPTVAVAELTIGIMITLVRRVCSMNHDLHNGHWEKQSGPQLAGKTVTIIGLGRIGLKVAHYLRAFEVRLLAVDPLRHGTIEGIPVLSLQDALPQSDIVSIHASGSQQILGRPEFALLRPRSYLINTGRGGLVDEAALCDALDNGTLAGAWLDTFLAEPYHGPLTKYKQVVLTPHIGYSSEESRRQMEMEAAENLLEGLTAL